jgi:hypothetical protein
MSLEKMRIRSDVNEICFIGYEEYEELALMPAGHTLWSATDLDMQPRFVTPQEGPSYIRARDCRSRVSFHPHLYLGALEEEPRNVSAARSLRSYTVLFRP